MFPCLSRCTMCHLAIYIDYSLPLPHRVHRIAVSPHNRQFALWPMQMLLLRRPLHCTNPLCCVLHQMTLFTMTNSIKSPIESLSEATLPFFLSGPHRRLLSFGAFLELSPLCSSTNYHRQKTIFAVLVYVELLRSGPVAACSVPFLTLLIFPYELSGQ